MAKPDLRECLNAISDVVVNRPKPLREFDQIYMKTADMLMQTEVVGRWLNQRRVIFIGDGDAIGLCLGYLHARELVAQGPESIHVMDFDERVVLSVQAFAQKYGIDNKVTAELYNVADPLPEKHWQQFQGFYTNPPFGASNRGRSMNSFIRRGIEACSSGCMGTVVMADDPSLRWTQEVIFNVQQSLVQQGFAISEMLPEFTSYHLDDAPDLRSCSMAVRKIHHGGTVYASQALGEDDLQHFYGENSSLQVRYVRDLSGGGRLVSRDHEMEAMPVTHQEVTDG